MSSIIGSAANERTGAMEDTVGCGMWCVDFVVRAELPSSSYARREVRQVWCGRALVPDAAGEEAENSIVAVVVESLQGRVRCAVLFHGGSGVGGIGREETMGVRRETQRELRPEGHRLHIGRRGRGTRAAARISGGGKRGAKCEERGGPPFGAADSKAEFQFRIIHLFYKLGKCLRYREIKDMAPRCLAWPHEPRPAEFSHHIAAPPRSVSPTSENKMG